jgi:hypothetical protein
MEVESMSAKCGRWGKFVDRYQVLGCLPVADRGTRNKRKAAGSSELLYPALETAN